METGRQLTLYFLFQEEESREFGEFFDLILAESLCDYALEKLKVFF
jgi:hypothetical protein